MSGEQSADPQCHDYKDSAVASLKAVPAKWMSARVEAGMTKCGDGADATTSGLGRHRPSLLTQELGADRAIASSAGEACEKDTRSNTNSSPSASALFVGSMLSCSRAAMSRIGVAALAVVLGIWALLLHGFGDLRTAVVARARGSTAKQLQRRSSDNASDTSGSSGDSKVELLLSRRLPTAQASANLPAAQTASLSQDGSEPELILWREFSPTQYMPALSLPWRLLMGLFRHQMVCRPSNDCSLGLQGWRRGLLDRWELKFPVLTIFDAPGRAAPGEGFTEWPLFDIFKIDLCGMADWEDYTTSLARDHRYRVRQRHKVFQSFEIEGRLICQVIRLGPEAFAPLQPPATPMAAMPPPAAAASASSPVHNVGDDGAADTEDIDERSSSSDGSRLGSSSSGRGSPLATSCSSSTSSLVSSSSASFTLSDDDSGVGGNGGVSEVAEAPAAPQPPESSPGMASRCHLQQQQQPQQVPQQRQSGKQTLQQQHHQQQAKSAKTGGKKPQPQAPPQLRFVTPGSVAEAEALLGQMWGLYEQTGTRNGFVECCREQFERLVREAPGVQAVVVREGGSGSGPLLAFGLLLPQRESLQLLYAGLQYDNPLITQSNCYFQIMFVAVQLAMEHNRSVRSHQQDPAPKPTAAAAAAATMSTATADADAAVAASKASKATVPAQSWRSSLPPPPPPPSLGPRVGLIDFLDLGPGRRFVKEHLGAVGHPVSMYTRGIGPISRVLSYAMLSRYLDAKALVNDP